MRPSVPPGSPQPCIALDMPHLKPFVMAVACLCWHAASVARAPASCGSSILRRGYQFERVAAMRHRPLSARQALRAVQPAEKAALRAHYEGMPEADEPPFRKRAWARS